MNRIQVTRPRALLRQDTPAWYRIKNEAGERPAVYLYEEIGFFGITADDFMRDVQEIKAEAFDVHVNTRGGEVFDGIAIYNTLLSHRAKVNVIVDSLAASIGSVIAMAGDTITMQKNAQIMIHDAHASCGGNASAMQEMAELLDKTSDNIASIYAERAGGDIKNWRKKMRAETWYSAEEAVEAGLADAVVGGRDSGAAENSQGLTVLGQEPCESKPVWNGNEILAALKEAL